MDVLIRGGIERPRIDDGDAQIIQIGDVARGEREAVLLRGGGDQRIGQMQRVPKPPRVGTKTRCLRRFRARHRLERLWLYSLRTRAILPVSKTARLRPLGSSSIPVFELMHGNRGDNKRLAIGSTQNRQLSALGTLHTSSEMHVRIEQQSVICLPSSLSSRSQPGNGDGRSGPARSGQLKIVETSAADFPRAIAPSGILRVSAL